MSVHTPEKSCPALPGYRTELQLAELLGKDPRTLLRWRKLRVGPAWTLVGKTPLYRIASTDAWLLAQEHEPVREKSRPRRRRAAAEARAEA